MPKALALNEIRSRAASFALDWSDSPGDERQDAQSFIRDLLGVYGITKTRAALYEKRVTRASTAGRGYIDALVPGVAVIEMKSAGRDLEQAERQALDYLDALTDAEMPRWVITSDFRQMRVLDLDAPAEVEPLAEFPISEFALNADRLAFFAGYGVRQFGSQHQEQASIDAARLMAGLWEELEGTGYSDHEASVFLVRTLFALYADDAGVWERDLFYEFLETRTAQDGSDLGSQLSFLYQVMARRPEERQRNLDALIARFPYVNGGVFNETLSIPAFDASMRGRLLAACEFNWSAISPAIFGSLFQAVKDKRARRELGEHYTTETNILKVIEPMFLDDLRDRFAHSQHDAKALRRLRTDMGKMRFLDPACGCGNFLVVAYREMRSLDLQVLTRLQELGGREAAAGMLFDTGDLPVRLENFHGIEIEEWPARIAATALHLVEHQANQAMELALGVGPDTLPLEKVDTIHANESALTLDWTGIVPPTENLYIFGNPPFLGHATRTPEQADELRLVWHRDDIGRLDYVTGWYAKALQLFAKPGYAGEFAFVSTNSITQGEPVPALFRPVLDAGWRVKFAHRTFAWTSEAPGAAAVHCVVVGFDKHRRRPAWLFDYKTLRGEPERHAVAERINPYLVDGPNVLIEQRREPLSPHMPAVTMGSMPRDGGHLIIGPDEYAEVAADPYAAKYLRRFIMGKELINNLPRWCLWLVDLEPSDVQHSPVLRTRLDAVRGFRLASRAASTRQMAETPHLFGQRSQPDVPYVGVPKVFAESRRWATCERLGPEVVAGDKVYTCKDPDGFAFAVFSSSAFILWQKTVGGRLKSDPSFSNTIVWNTLPIPSVSESLRTSIIEGGSAVVEARGLHPHRSLAEHYNPLAMSPELLRAHRTLDTAVDRALGLRGGVDDNARLKALFTAYAKFENRPAELHLSPVRR
ncbi:class I SAM-dependent DNA methyltransferase [Cellulomonas denverensis]|uniref:site-specific DNA-methyltransferase (adenine-specific) n=1 Tax=Cellulomonas denverensis TaxID=264297 RepID=A0A7X6KU90_9CELL|nr:class I SAM-dependent DNA methyltransferase [Cellulomonas denverensis]NKY22248.1 class I SAM-dependent DNA methyltransferase [Cellulomonas denverensis]GIG26912.1 methylase [Cellulomonas denverensis]